MVQIFTSAAPNYFAKVRVLFDSCRAHCPDARLTWSVPDRATAEVRAALVDAGADELLFLDDLAPFESASWQFQHNIVEVSTAIKPHVASRLLTRVESDVVIYLDPDVVLFSPIDDLVDEISRASVLLTPHFLEPHSSQRAVRDHELCALRHGVFNLGFFAIRDCEESRTFLSWWHERCWHHCDSDWRASGAFTDQKWIDFAPVFFPGIGVLRSKRFNVAPWNVCQRRIAGDVAAGLTVDGEALGFYHFTGFDSGAHASVLAHYARDNPAARRLVDWYATEIGRSKGRPHMRWRLADYEDGTPIRDGHRRIYREREDLRRAFPEPYRTDPTDPSLLGWLRTQGRVEYPGRLTAPGAF